MTTKIIKCTIAIGAVITILSQAYAQPVLTDITLFSTDANGNYSPLDVWVTRPSSFIAGLFIESGNTFLNGPNNAQIQPSISLPLGNTSLRLFGDPGADNSTFGINLFFGSLSPSISAVAPMLTSAGQAHAFSANGAPSTSGPPGVGNIPAAGTLSFVSGNERITLTDFYWATPSVYDLDQVGFYNVGPDGANDYVGGITFSVTEIPEPVTGLWIVAAVIGFLRFRHGVVMGSVLCIGKSAKS